MRIGIAGLAGAGKNVVADILIKHCKDTPIVPLATPIKDFWDVLLGFDERHREGDLKEVNGYVDFTIEDFVNTLESLYGITRNPLKAQAFNTFIQCFTETELKMSGQHVSLYTSPRRLYQVWGTEVWRKIGGDKFWIDQLPKRCIVPDIRFDNEAEAMDYVIHVKRGNTLSRAALHASENGISEGLIDYQLNNRYRTTMETMDTLLNVFDDLEEQVTVMIYSDLMIKDANLC